ncbi:MAG: tetratricopeptide repeat protein, partial [Leptospiraceae bacterium]|nr:tetratricopeptide repeat protein [Leptospiraceae bacterium]
MKLKQSFPRKNVIVALIVLSLPLFSGSAQEMPSLILDRAFSNFFNGEYDKAAEYFERYTKAEGDQEAPLRYLAQIYSAKGDLKKSIDCLERGVKVAPDSIESMLLLAEAYLKVNQPGNSIKTLDKVLEIDEFNVRALHFQAYLHQQKNDSRKTASYFKRLIVAVRNGAGSEQFLQSAYTFLGNYYYQRQEFLRAVDYYEKLVQVDEGTGRSLLVLGELYKITGQFDKSLQTMNLLIQKNPGNVSAHESRVETLYILNDRSTLDRIQILKTKSAKLNSLVEAFQLQIEKKTDESLVLVREFLKENPSRLSGHICLLRNMQNLQAQGKIDPVEVRNEAYAIMILAQRLGAHQLALDYADLVFPVLYKQANDSNFNLTFFQADRSASKLNSVHEQIAIDHMELYESHSVTQENLQKITHAI